jgi:hypothetical protein
MCQSVTGPLKNWNGRMWDSAVEWITKDAGTKFRNGEELEARFQDLADSGIEVIPIGTDCDNFDSKKGCLGHPVPDFVPQPDSKHP